MVGTIAQQATIIMSTRSSENENSYPQIQKTAIKDITPRSFREEDEDESSVCGQAVTLLAQGRTIAYF